MKKIFITFVLFFLVSISTTFAQYFESKTYHDYARDFSGYAGAMYLGNFEDASFEKIKDYFNSNLPASLKKISKISKKTKWLIQQSLNEWDYEEGEIYAVICTENQYSKEGTFFIIQIIDKSNFNWVGYAVTQEDLENFSFD